MDRSQKPRSIQEYIYWAIFIFVAVLMSNIIMEAIHASNREQTSFTQSVAAAKKRPLHYAVIETNKGPIRIAFKRSVAPIAVANFSQLASSGFYDGTKFHRVVKNVLIQGGDPLSREGNRELYGTGGPGYVFEDEISDLPLQEGSVAMANRGKPDTNESQFFIVVSDDAVETLTGKYTIFAQVVEGMEIVRMINNTPLDNRGIPLDPIVVESVTVE